MLRASKHVVVLFLSPLGACISYEEPAPADTGAEREPPAERPEVPDTELEPESDPPGPMHLSPAGGVQGEVVIVSLVGDGTVDLRQVTAITFFGDGELGVLAVSPRSADEYLVTVDIPAAAERGTNHLLVELAEGSMKFVEDAFAVVGDPLEIPPSEPPDCG